MSELKATPGPWFVYSDDEVRQSYGAIVVVPDSGEFSEGVYEDLVDDRLRRKANAHLIAAAHELYEAVNGLLEALPSSTAHPAIKAARAALAKARGEPCDTAG